MLYSSKAIPIWPCFRQTIWQGFDTPTDGTASTKLSGNQSGFVSTMRAPVAEISRTVQSTADDPNRICPALKIRRRVAARPFCIAVSIYRQFLKIKLGHREIRIGTPGPKIRPMHHPKGTGRGQYHPK